MGLRTWMCRPVPLPQAASVTPKAEHKQLSKAAKHSWIPYTQVQAGVFRPSDGKLREPLPAPHSRRKGAASRGCSDETCPLGPGQWSLGGWATPLSLSAQIYTPAATRE